MIQPRSPDATIEHFAVTSYKIRGLISFSSAVNQPPDGRCCNFPVHKAQLEGNPRQGGLTRRQCGNQESPLFSQPGTRLTGPGVGNASAACPGLPLETDRLWKGNRQARSKDWVFPFGILQQEHLKKKTTGFRTISIHRFGSSCIGCVAAGGLRRWDVRTLRWDPAALRHATSTGRLHPQKTGGGFLVRCHGGKRGFATNHTDQDSHWLARFFVTPLLTRAALNLMHALTAPEDDPELIAFFAPRHSVLYQISSRIFQRREN
ncbi:hypothetical protein V8F06_002421 [Rhypophila decipiens]